MKELVSLLKESVTPDKWESMSHMDAGKYHKDAQFIGINTQDGIITWWSEEEIGYWEEDDMMDPEDIQTILKLKPGELFDADGGINIYVRFRK